MKKSKIRLSKITIISLGLLNFVYFKANSQVQTKFFRPSMTTTFMKPTSSEATKIYAAFASTPMEARFDNRVVSNNSITVSLPARPQMPTSENLKELKSMMDNHKKSVAEWESAKAKQINAKLSGIGKDIIANMFGRDNQGNLNYDKIMDAASYSSSDAQALSAGASENKNVIYTEIAEELLKRGYIVVYDIKSTQTYDQFYNASDAKARAAAAKTGKPATPVKRTSEGWMIDFDYSIYRLVWNDSVSTIFYTQAWLDASTTDPSVRAEKKSAFDSFAFPLELVFSGSSNASASQSNDASYYEKLKIKRKSMDELLTELPVDMQNSMVFNGGRKIEDFKMRAPIFQVYPTTVKLGNKEGLYYDERFYVFEIKQNKKTGESFKKRRGVLRASNIVDNSTIADGKSPASTFRQEGGKALYQGTLVELKEDFGLGLNIGYGLMDKFVGGVNLGIEARIPNFLKGKANWAKYLRGLYLNANVGYNILPEDEVWASYPDYKYSGSSMALGVSLSRETYIFKKGNLYVMPEIGGGILSVTLNEYFSDGTALNAGSMYVNGGLGIGLHVSPMISIFAKAGFNMRLGDATWTDENDTEYDVSTIGEFSTKSGFNKLNGMTTPVSVGLRFRF